MIVASIKEAIRDSFVFSGRSERLEHWAFLLFTGIWVAIFQILGKYDLVTIFPVNWFFLLFFIWLCVANVALMVRRLHDHDLSGFWLFLPLAPIFMMLVAAKAMYGSGVPLLTASDGEVLFKISQGGLVATLVLFGSMFVREGNRKSNQYGGPL